MEIDVRDGTFCRDPLKTILRNPKVRRRHYFSPMHHSALCVRISKLPPLILGVLSAFCGIGLLGEPWIGMKFIALLLAIFFAVEGIWKIVASFNYRPATGWLALLASGILTLILGLLIWRQWPLSGLWAVGVLVGINLLMTGISMVTLAATARRLKSVAEEGAAG